MLISSLTGLISLAQIQNMFFFSNLVANIQRCDCTYFSCGRESAAKYSSAVAAGTASFCLYYSLVFDDSPRAQCQQASAGTGFAGGGGIYCVCVCACAGGSLVHLLTCSSIFEPQQRAVLGDSRNICKATSVLCCSLYIITK